MSRKIQFAPGEYYHLYNRGTEKRSIFIDAADHRRFVILLYYCNCPEPIHLQIRSSALNEFDKFERNSTLVEIGAYCLMPNHFHILLKEKGEGGISAFMQKLGTAYTMYFNKRYERSGALFQGRFKATHVDNDTYLKYVSSYIHLNPIKIIDPNWKENKIAQRDRARSYLQKYKYSSYLDYSGNDRPETKILERDSFPKYFDAKELFEAEIDDWLSYSDL